MAANLENFMRMVGRPVIDPVGMWVTEDGYIRQELLADHRYDEARGNHKHAYQGRYEVTGHHIHYWDDTGFEADGNFVDGVLHHIGMRFHRT
ncbi:Atu4866 domain-containing protein [Dyella sp. 7MK23]|uniref:Atu4866 domain-containing protein n=1 Tax=Dyella acidiphila TaxID=2775866 RepID=A0ABR9GEL8_9GAMM|nr:Atu4866 domain-containing protein [Dyella acidiphila]